MAFSGAILFCDRHLEHHLAASPLGKVGGSVGTTVISVQGDVYSISDIQSQWRWWIGERLQCLLHGEKKLWRMCDGYVVDLIVIEFRIAVRENVAEPYDVTVVRNRFRKGALTP